MKTLIILSGFLLFLLAGCQISPRMKETTISLKEIRSIGELVTAEYSGEVITSLNLMSVTEKKESIEADRVLLANAVSAPDYKKFRSGATDTEQAAYERLSKITGDCKNNLLENCRNYSGGNFNSCYEKAIEKYLQPKTKKEVVYLARGSVKAGFDLTKLDSLNLAYSAGGDTLYIRNFDPFQTDVDINPWFYCSGKSGTNETGDSSLYGYQLVYADKAKEATLDEINKVKTDCKILLYQQAIDRDILAIARRNAEKTLTALLSVMKLQGKPSIECVVIQNSPYFEWKQDLLYDLTISKSELDSLQSYIPYLIDSFRKLYTPSELQKQFRQMDQFVDDLYQSSLYHDNADGWDIFAKETMNKLLNP